MVLPGKGITLQGFSGKNVDGGRGDGYCGKQTCSGSEFPAKPVFRCKCGVEVKL